MSRGRLRNEAVVVLGQKKLLQRLVPGLVHAFVFWGFLVLFPTILLAIVGIVEGEEWLPSGSPLALAGAPGLVCAARRRLRGARPRRRRGGGLHPQGSEARPLRGEPPRRGRPHPRVDRRDRHDVAPLACDPDRARPRRVRRRLVAGLEPALAASSATARVTEALERAFVWAHVLLILAFLAYLPHSKHLHILTAAINVFFGRTRARGRLEPLRFDDEAEADVRFGSGTVADMTWKQTVDTLSCTECGRCQDACPAWATGKALSPKLLIMGLRDQLLAEGPKLLADGSFEPSPLVPNAVTDDVVWDCVTCGACVRECPVEIEHIDHIVDLRRHLVMVESRFPAEADPMLRDVERSSNPWGKPQAERGAWAEALGVRVLEPGDPAPELLYWVGCAGSFDERARRATEATAKLLQAAGVDFAILGPRESCTGDPARRMGNEYVFQSFAEQNVETLNGAGVEKIVTSCPHCFNTLGTEYPDFGGSYEVRHHTELLADLLREGRLSPSRDAGTITYHDSCYLARHNDVRMEPRELVSAVGQPVEMARSGVRTFCCGAGGAHMWMEERGRPINEERVREAAETGAATLAVACPFCTVMLDDGVQASGRDLRVVDVAQLLAEAIEPGS